MRTIKIPQVIEKQTGNYQLPNSYDRKNLNRGTIEFALDTLARLYKVQPKEAVPYNRVFSNINYNNFNNNDVLNTIASILNGEAVSYVFYGDFIISCLNNPNLTNDDTVQAVMHTDLLNKSLGYTIVGQGYSAGGGVGSVSCLTFNNCFVTNLSMTNTTGLPADGNNTAKFEGWLIRIA